MLKQLGEGIRQLLERFRNKSLPFVGRVMGDQHQGEAPKRLHKSLRYAILLGYNGKQYYGMQFQRAAEFPTIESKLLEAMWKSGIINDEQYRSPPSIQLMRAARTDRSVSAARQVINWAKMVNAHLPDDIRMFGIRRTIPSYHAQRFCDSRTYSYTLPSFAFAEPDALTNEHYRITPERIQEIDDILREFIGTKNFFNYTSKREFTERHCRRYIISFRCDEPFLYKANGKDMEFITLQCRGQSFMMHQIRKIVGTAIAIARGLMNREDLKRSFTAERMDIPRAPGNGLMLERLHYDMYEMRYCGEEKVHQSLNNWDDEVETNIAKFRREVIFEQILADEVDGGIMFAWLRNMQDALLFFKDRGIVGADDTPTIRDIVTQALIQSFDIFPPKVEAGKEDDGEQPNGMDEDGEDEMGNSEAVCMEGEEDEDEKPMKVARRV